MTNKENSSIWRESDFQRPLYVLEDPRTSKTGLPVNYHGVPLAPLDTKVTAPQDLLAAEEERLYGDKLILSFEGNATSRQANAWIAAYNKGNDFCSLSLDDQLINSIFVVKINAPRSQSSTDLLLPTIKANLLVKSPLRALDRYVSVNPYYPEFNPERPHNFKQLVKVLIRDGSPFIYKFLDFILQPVGRVIRGSCATGLEQHRIIALVETTQKRFVSQVTFVFNPERSILIRLDYRGISLRCYKCFSYSHNAADCSGASSIPEPLPATVSFQAKCPSCSHNAADCSGLSSIPPPPSHLLLSTPFLQAHSNLASQHSATDNRNDAIFSTNEATNRRNDAVNRNDRMISRNETIDRKVDAIISRGEATNKRNDATNGLNVPTDSRSEATNRRVKATTNSKKGTNSKKIIPLRPHSPLLEAPSWSNVRNSRGPSPPKLVAEQTHSHDTPKLTKRLECQTADEDQDQVASSKPLDLTEKDEDNDYEDEAAAADFLIELNERRADGIFLESDDLRMQAIVEAKRLKSDQAYTTSTENSALPLGSTQGQCPPTLAVSKTVSAPTDTTQGQTKLAQQKWVPKSVLPDSPTPTTNGLSAGRSHSLPPPQLAPLPVARPLIATNSAPVSQALSQDAFFLRFGIIQSPNPYIHPNICVSGVRTIAGRDGCYPERPGELDCNHYLRTGICKYGRYCKWNHPPNRKLVRPFVA